MDDTLTYHLNRFEAEHEFLRQLVIPEEDRHRYTTTKWAGEYRWFRSANVVCLEKARLVRGRRMDQVALSAAKT